MGPIPRTGPRTLDPKVRDRGRYARDPPQLEASTGGDKAGMSLIVQEEERVNGRLVDILERKCAKVRQRAEDEEQQRKAAEEQLAAARAELSKLHQHLGDCERQLEELRAVQCGLADDCHAADRRAAALQGVQQERDAVQRALRDREHELKRERAEAAQAEADWKQQVVKLISEAQATDCCAAELKAELHRLQAENSELMAKARELVGRYEVESAQRLELEERCIALEEKLSSGEQRSRSDLNVAEQKAKQNLHAKQRAEEVSSQCEERCRAALRRVELAEQRCKALEAEQLRLRALCSDRGRRLEALEDRAAAVPAQPPSDGAAVQPPCRLPLPVARPRTGHRPGTCSSAASALSAGGSAGSAAPSAREARGTPAQACFGQGPARSSGEDAAAASRLPPGAIRRAGSVPLRRQPNRMPESRSHSVRTQQTASASATASASRTCAVSDSSQSNSRPNSALANIDISNTIPDEINDSSDDEEVVQTTGYFAGMDD